MVLALSLVTMEPTKGNAVEIPQPDSNLYILDVSGSLYTQNLWQSLKESIQEKLTQPFGNPGTKKFPAEKSIDISVSTISKISSNAKIFHIVTKSDSKEVWGDIEKKFPRSNSARMERIIEALFKPGGAWTEQAKIFSNDVVVSPSQSNCQSEMLDNMKNTDWIKNTDLQIRSDLSVKLCKKLIEISSKFIEADKYMASPICKPTEKCSDVIGAINRATTYAKDLLVVNKNIKNTIGLCVAIASDMIHDTPRLKQKSALDSRHHALKALTVDDARTAGSNAAKSVGIQFPKNVRTRIVLVGLGTGPNPILDDRASYLLAYWNGFFTSSGINSSSQEQSLNKACV